ncbi:MAG: PH domain-containing protein [Planctomycetota bacterium]
MNRGELAPPGFVARTLEPYLKLPTAPPPLPAGAHTAKTFRASRQYLKYRYAKVTIGSLIAIPELIALFGGAFAGNVLLGILATIFGCILFSVVVTLVVAVIRLEYDLRQYVVTDRSLRIRGGAIVISEVTITFANIQDVEISQGPLQRWFGIADVIVHTAGGSAPTKKGGQGDSSHHGALSGIEQPAELRDYILREVRAFRDSGLGDPDDPHHRTEQPAEPLSVTNETDAALAELRDATASLRLALAQS